jgi:hypothetical protein
VAFMTPVTQRVETNQAGRVTASSLMLSAWVPTPKVPPAAQYKLIAAKAKAHAEAAYATNDVGRDPTLDAVLDVFLVGMSPNSSAMFRVLSWLELALSTGRPFTDR